MSGSIADVARFRAFAAWQETTELKSDSLDAADAWARAILSDHPEASVYVMGDDFSGGWFVPKPPRPALAGKREHKATHR